MRTRGGMLRVLVAWTLMILALGVVLAIQGIASLDAEQQACFLRYPAIPCPGNDDPAIARIAFAFFGLPVVWLVGLGLAALVRVRRRGRDASPR